MTKSAKQRSYEVKLRAKQNGKCCYCNVEMTPRNSLNGIVMLKTAETTEHLQRKENGGLNNPDNLALACHGCNVGRGAVDWFTYKTYVCGEIFS